MLMLMRDIVTDYSTIYADMLDDADMSYF